MTSTVNASGGTPVSFKTCSTSSAKLPFASWRPDTFTARPTVGSDARRHSAQSRHACSSTQRPMTVISPLHSASGTNSAGATLPNLGCRHRTSASRVRGRRVATSHMG